MGHTIICFILALFLVACEKSEDKFPDEHPTATEKEDYQALSQSILEGFTYGGFGVVSRKPDGSPEHQGEALIWGGTYLWSAPCELSRPVSEALAAMILRLEGQLIRVDPLGEYQGGREVTLDGAIGAMLGVARRVVDCGEKELFDLPWQKLISFQTSNREILNRQVSATMVGEFRYVRDLIGHAIGFRGEPTESRLRDLEKTLGGWALAVQTAHATGVGSDACFRVNLSLSSILTVETLGKQISQAGRDQFCQNTKGMDIPTVSHWCGRESITGYIATYQPDEWEYRHQRCQWESPDGKGNRSPQLDKVVAYVLANGWHSLQN